MHLRQTTARHQRYQVALAEIGNIYMVDLVCDADLSRFYAELGFATTTGMSRRDYDMQPGRV